MIDNITSTSTTQLIKEFELTMGNPEYPVTLHLPISVPCSDDPAELAHRVIQHHNLPIYMLEELTFELRKFQNAVSSSVEKEQALSQLARLHSGKISVDDIAHFWEDMDFQRWPSPAEDAELPHLYHALIHSEEGSALLQLEHQYSREVAVLVRRRDDCVKELSESQAVAMVDAMSLGASDAQVNALTTEQLEAAQVACAEWNSAITALREQQLRTFQAVLRDGSVAGQVQSPVPTISPDPAVPLLEESFTIHLGTQMKQMYNLRLVAADAVTLCDYAQQDGCDLPPQRIQTSLQLYGRSLHGMVMMVDDRVNSYSGIKKEFGAVCGRATELHFPHLDQQLEDIRERLVPAVGSWRGRRAGGESGDCAPGRELQIRSPATSLLPGDVYITRHSNLSGVHVVFHVVCDDSLRSAAIGSRHAVILGLRNLLKVACLCDLSSLSLPLLLSHTLAEHMTVPWCLRRAELVYKCVKGFMMEMASWGGAHINTLHFVLPKNISEAQFQALSAMLPSIFRVSNPLVVTADPPTHSSL